MIERQRRNNARYYFAAPGMALIQSKIANTRTEQSNFISGLIFRKVASL